MAWVRFSRKWRWRLPAKGVAFLTFKGGRAYSVKAACAAAAIADGAATAHRAPRRGEDLNKDIETDGPGA